MGYFKKKEFDNIKHIITRDTLLYHPNCNESFDSHKNAKM